MTGSQLSFPVRLNKYLSIAGVGTRRQTEKFIQQGKVTVNGRLVDKPFFPVKEDDLVHFEGRIIFSSMDYFLINKKAGWESEALSLHKQINIPYSVAASHYFFLNPLSAEARGLTIITNDFKLQNKNPEQVYLIRFEEKISSKMLNQIKESLYSDSASFTVKGVNFMDNMWEDVLGITIAEGGESQIRHILEEMELKILAVDRTMMAGITKKDLPRGKYRPLNNEEVRRLRYFL